jgi:hypothetical protein
MSGYQDIRIAQEEKRLQAQLSSFFKHKMPAAVVYRHEGQRVAGLPDMSVTWNNHTSWLELKHAVNGHIRTREVQKVRMHDLARATSRFWYVVYYEDKNGKRTYILRPEELFGSNYQLGTPEERTSPGHDHMLVLRHVIGTHRP